MMITLQIHRFVDDKKWIQEYKLETQKGMTILEGFNEIKAKQDATLSFTSSCRSSICGACAVRVNGNAELACEILLEDLVKRYKTNTLTVEPLGNFRVIRDLIVDWIPKYEKMKKIDPVVRPKAEFTPVKGCKQSIEDFDKYKKYAGCILCGSCVSECNKSALDEKDFLDPFIFVKAAKITEDSRERSPEDHLRAVVQAGLWKCFNCQECTAKCPKDLDPAGAIEKLKAASIALTGDGSVGANHAKAIYNDIYTKGMLDESKLAVQSEGMLSAAMRVPVAYRLMKTGKLNMFEKIPENKEIHEIRQIIDIAEKENK
jgi:succinate dehydrogenase / fumarate reductase, iron-sulfur subunit